MLISRSGGTCLIHATSLPLTKPPTPLSADIICECSPKGESKRLETAWGECNAHCADRLKALREHLNVWREYKENRDYIQYT